MWGRRRLRCRLSPARPNASSRHPRLQTGIQTRRYSKPSVAALCLLPDRLLAAGSDHETIRLYDVATGGEVARLELDALVIALVALGPNRRVAGDELGLLHWLEVLG